MSFSVKTLCLLVLVTRTPVTGVSEGIRLGCCELELFPSEFSSSEESEMSFSGCLPVFFWFLRERSLVTFPEFLPVIMRRIKLKVL